MSALAVDMQQTVRAACLWLPESEEFTSHGSPNFRVRGKTFATYVVNHHGDGRVALWLPAAPGAQEHHVRAFPDHFFVPPYVGPRGWVGVRLPAFRPQADAEAARARDGRLAVIGYTPPRR